MKKILFLLFIFVLLLTPVYLYIFTQISPSSAASSEPYSKNVIVSSPTPDAVVNGTFAIKGKVESPQNIQSIRIVVTAMYDKTQEPVKIYTAVYNPKTAEWVADVTQGDLPDDTYALCVEVNDGNGKQQTTYSSVVIDSSVPMIQASEAKEI